MYIQQLHNKMSYRFTCLIEAIVEFDSSVPASNGNQLVIRVHSDAVKWTSSKYKHHQQLQYHS